jgi:hypothetical protein
MTSLRRALTCGALAVLCTASGCVPATQGAGSARGGGAQLTRQELAEVTSDNIYDAIAKLRPEWLTSRGPTSVTDGTPSVVDVYMDGTRLGKADYLRQVRLLDVTEVRYWDAGQASARFGMGHPRGVIEITRK